MARSTKGFYQVAPRYTSGSPGMVDERTARMVIEQERRSYYEALEGTFGNEELQRAKRLGLLGIAEFVTETKDGWKVIDLSDDSLWLRPIKLTKKFPRTFEYRKDDGTWEQVKTVSEDRHALWLKPADAAEGAFDQVFRIDIDTLVSTRRARIKLRKEGV